MYELWSTDLMLDLHHSSISAIAKRSRKDIVTSLPSYTKLASPFLGAAQQCRALLLCPKPTQLPAPCSHSLDNSHFLPLNSLQNLSTNRFHCAIINTGHNSMWENHTTVLQICLTHSSTPKYPNQFSVVHSSPCVKGTWPSHPFCFLHAQIQSCPIRRMLIMAALKHKCFLIFISLNQGWITGNTKSLCHRNLFCFS